MEICASMLVRGVITDVPFPTLLKDAAAECILGLDMYRTEAALYHSSPCTPRDRAHEMVSAECKQTYRQKKSAPEGADFFTNVCQRLQVFANLHRQEFGRHDWTRTNDPYHVKVVL